MTDRYSKEVIWMINRSKKLRHGEGDWMITPMMYDDRLLVWWLELDIQRFSIV